MYVDRVLYFKTWFHILHLEYKYYVLLAIFFFSLVKLN